MCGGIKKMVFQKIDGVKKIIRCVVCGRRIQVQNLNQMKCSKCGYRGSKPVIEV
jgi:DNA-directed RNA polymerase subunit RPC12/RpoP